VASFIHKLHKGSCKQLMAPAGSNSLGRERNVWCTDVVMHMWNVDGFSPNTYMESWILPVTLRRARTPYPDKGRRPSSVTLRIKTSSAHGTYGGEPASQGWYAVLRTNYKIILVGKKLDNPQTKDDDSIATEVFPWWWPVQKISKTISFSVTTCSVRENLEDHQEKPSLRWGERLRFWFFTSCVPFTFHHSYLNQIGPVVQPVKVKDWT